MFKNFPTISPFLYKWLLESNLHHLEIRRQKRRIVQKAPVRLSRQPQNRLERRFAETAAQRASDNREQEGSFGMPHGDAFRAMSRRQPPAGRAAPGRGPPSSPSRRHRFALTRLRCAWRPTWIAPPGGSATGVGHSRFGEPVFGGAGAGSRRKAGRRPSPARATPPE